MSRAGAVVKVWAAVIAGIVLVGLSGCGTYVPKGATVIRVTDSRAEFERGELRPPENELREMSVIKMKWYDTNTFITTATLSPGVYSFMARNFDGAAFRKDIAISAEEDYYELSAGVKADGETAQAAATPALEGPEIKGRILSAQAARIANVSVLFIGREVILKTANVTRDGTFTVNAPKPGTWKIEVHQLGNKPVSYVHPVTDIKGPVNLGAISLR